MGTRNQSGAEVREQDRVLFRERNEGSIGQESEESIEGLLDQRTEQMGNKRTKEGSKQSW